MMAIQEIKNFIRVSPSLSTAGQPSEDQLHELAKAGFEVIINLGLLDPRYCLADEEGLVESLGMKYHHIPIDFTAPQPRELDSFFDVMEASRDKNVFVHCAANYRVSTFVGLYAQARMGWSVDQADAHIRRVWEPNDTWQAFIDASRAQLKRSG